MLSNNKSQKKTENYIPILYVFLLSSKVAQAKPLQYPMIIIHLCIFIICETNSIPTYTGSQSLKLKIIINTE